MREYSNKISLIKNSRGIFCIDTSIGCSSGMAAMPGGCYGDCYAAKSAKLYGYDFSKTSLRHFENESHKRQLVLQISAVTLDFVRIGCSGDPSEDWEHLINIVKVISRAEKEIVIITKHWSNLTDSQLLFLSTKNVCINTSVSALDEPLRLSNSLNQYNRIKPYCKSVLRIVSCDFNLENETGRQLDIIQRSLFTNDLTIDTVFRPSKTSEFITNGVIRAQVGTFNGHKALMSKRNRKTYTGKCSGCHEMCGQRFKDENFTYSNKRKLVKQGSFFRK